MHASANAASINFCLQKEILLSSDQIKRYSYPFYKQGAQWLNKRGVDWYVNGLNKTVSMPLVKKEFKMDNYCDISTQTFTTRCATTNQSIEDLQIGKWDPSGPAANNGSIRAMVDSFKRADFGAVHFDCSIKIKPQSRNRHAVIVSFVKEKHKERPSIIYMDSNNAEISEQPEALDLIKLLFQAYGQELFLSGKK